MTIFDWAAPEALASALTTELNALANGSFSAASAAVDNSTGTRYEYIMLEVNLASLSPAAGAFVDVWIEYAPDGTTHSDHGKLLQTGGVLATFQLDTAAATAQRLPAVIKPLLPMKFKLSLRNQAGVALNASGNTLKYARVTGEGV
jgi:hypothetical protein